MFDRWQNSGWTLFFIILSFKAIFFWNKVKLKSQLDFNEEVWMLKCNCTRQCKWKMKAGLCVSLSMRRKLSVLHYSAAASRNIWNPQLSGTESFPKPSEKPVFKATHVNCASTQTNTHTHSSFLFRKGITLSIIVDRCSLQERDWKSSMHSREETEWGSSLWIIIGDVAIPKISTKGNSWICWLHNGGREKKK